MRPTILASPPIAAQAFAIELHGIALTRPGALPTLSRSFKRLEGDVRKLLLGGGVAVGAAVLGIAVFGARQVVRADDAESGGCPVTHSALRSALVTADANDH